MLNTVIEGGDDVRQQLPRRRRSVVLDRQKEYLGLGGKKNEEKKEREGGIWSISKGLGVSSG